MPSYLSWWYSTIGIKFLNIIESDNIFAPIDEWDFILEYSSSVNLSFLNNILSGISDLPISWNKPPTLSKFNWLSGSPKYLPIKTEYAETLSQWPRV